jgi:hypothetical protein
MPRSQNHSLPVSRSPWWKSTPPSRFPIRAPMERYAHHQGLLYIPLKIPYKGTALQVPLEVLRREMPITRAFYTYHLKMIPPARFPSQSPHREGCSISKTRLYLSLKGPGKEPPIWLPKQGPHGKRRPSLEPSYEYINSLITHFWGKNSVHQAEPPCWVRLQYNWEVAWYLRGRHLRQTYPLPFIP